MISSSICDSRHWSQYSRYYKVPILLSTATAVVRPLEVTQGTFILYLSAFGPEQTICDDIVYVYLTTLSFPPNACSTVSTWPGAPLSKKKRERERKKCPSLSPFASSRQRNSHGNALTATGPAWPCATSHVASADIACGSINGLRRTRTAVPTKQGRHLAREAAAAAEPFSSSSPRAGTRRGGRQGDVVKGRTSIVAHFARCYFSAAGCSAVAVSTRPWSTTL